MNIRLSVILFSIVIFLPSFVLCQNYETVSFDTRDSTAGYYLAIPPQSKQVKGVLVLLSSFLPPESLLAETKLHNVAYGNDILTIVASMKQKLYADSSAVDRITRIFKSVVARFSADTGRFALAGYDEAGNIALRYTELAYENPSAFLVQPKAVFGIDAPVDLFGLWHWAEKQISKNYWPGSVGDAKYYLDIMTKENGTIYNNAERYKVLSPFYREEQFTGNEQYLKNVPVRLYYDTDMDWQLKNRRNSFFDTKMPDGSELIKRLLFLGNNEAEFVASKQPGARSSGIRHPNSFSIVDEIECIQWIKKSLNIFDINTAILFYNLIIPAGWSVERFLLPPGFAPQIKYNGIEDVRFAPGWGDVKSEEHWSYSFLWWLEGETKPDTHILQANLKAYYTGLVATNITSSDVSANKVTVVVKKIATAANDLETYRGTITMFDYHAKLPITLNCLIHVKDCTYKNRTAIYFELSPKPFSHPNWKKMKEIGDSFFCKNSQTKY